MQTLPGQRLRIALVAGEASGDLLGAGLIAAIAEKCPGSVFEGVAGPRMQAAGCEALAQAEELAVMGLIEPLRHVPRLLRLRSALARRWRDDPPDVFVGIDAPDFNLGLERRLKAAGVPTLHYVSPSVWAWRQGRVKTIGRAADRVLCLLPFEADFYARHDVAAEFVGHPLADRLPAPAGPGDARRTLGMGEGAAVTVMPGSRRSEVERLGPVFAETARRLRERYPDLAFVTPLASAATRALFEAQLERAGIADLFTLIDGRSADAILAGDVVLLASGTAALESALLCRATVAAYRLAPLTYWLARKLRLVKVAHFTLPNQLTDEPLVPEFLQDGANPEALCAAVAELLDDKARRADIERRFLRLRETLALDASARAADAVLAAAR